MGAHRYWRVSGIQTRSAGLALSELQLFNEATRVDLSATISANVSPTTGSLADLRDGSVSTIAAWLAVVGLNIVWDFGSNTVVTGIRLGSSALQVNHPLAFRFEYSDDAATWLSAELAPYPNRDRFEGIKWVGPNALDTFTTADQWSKRDFSSTQLSNLTFTNSDKTATEYLGSVYSLRGKTARESGIRQFEITLSGAVSASRVVGIAKANGAGNYPGETTSSWGYGAANKSFYNAVQTTYGAALASGNVIGVVVDFGAGTVTFYRNGVSQGVAYTDPNIATNGGVYPATGAFQNNVNLSGASLATAVMAYPVAGATPWGSDRAPEWLNWSGITDVRDTPIVATNGAMPLFSGALDVAPQRARRDYNLGGNGRIAGTVKEIGTPNAPVFRRVRLIRERDGMPVREIWSNQVTGAYSFDYIDELQLYTVLSYDHLGNYRAVVADRLTPEVIA